jgi:hypothetical protein
MDYPAGISTSLHVKCVPYVWLTVLSMLTAVGRALHPSNNSSGSGLTSPSLPPLGAETYSYDALKTDPLVASIESQRIKCTLCLAWINVELQHERAVREWRQHRTTCVASYVGPCFIATPSFIS